MTQDSIVIPFEKIKILWLGGMDLHRALITEGPKMPINH